MTRRMIKVMSAMAALSIVMAGVTATANAAPAAAVQQVAEEQGVLIVSVQKDGPAAKAGLRRGDIVLKINDTDVNDAAALRAVLAELKAGDEVEVRIARGDGELTLKVTLGDADGRAILGVTPFGNQPTQPVTPAQPAQPSTPRGPRGQQMDPKQAEELRKQLEEQFAAMSQTRVAEVTEDSPAAKAGLQKDDVILGVNDTELKGDTSLAEVIGGFKPGDEVTLKIQRDGKEQELKVELGENPDKEGAAFLGIRYAPSFNIQGMPGGFNLPFPMPMPGQDRERGQGNLPFELPQMPEGMSGAMVSIGEVVEGSPAEKAGLKQGDVITAANDKEITEPTQLVDLVKASKPGDEVTLSVTRQGEEKPLEIVVTLGENPDNEGAAFMGVALGSFVRFVRMQPDQGGEGSEGFQIVPGFNLPFNFDFGDLPFEIPQQQPSENDSEA